MIIALAIATHRQFLEKTRQQAGAPEYRPYLREFISATETNIETLERKVKEEAERKLKREARRNEATLARRRSIEATQRAQEAIAHSNAAQEEAQRLMQEYEAMSDRSSREASPESASST
jgi:tRNA U34 5-carboxymethylaminomethyl modifying GTPase MnmE/TrmE